MKHSILFFLLTLFPLLLSSCYDSHEPNDIAYVIAVGIDEAEEEGLYSFTLQYARPAHISGLGESSGDGEETTCLITLHAPSLYSAIDSANHCISKNLTLAHVKTVVFAAAVAKEGNGITKWIDLFGRNAELRPGVFVCVSTGRAAEYLAAVSPTIELNPVKYYRLIFENKSSSYIAHSNAHDVYTDLKTGLKNICVPLVGSYDGDDVFQAPSPKSSGFFKTSYLAGSSGIEKKNSAETLGSAVFAGGRLQAFFTSGESELLNILCGSYNSGYLCFYPYPSSAPKTVHIEKASRPKIRIDTSSPVPVIYADLSFEGVFISLSDGDIPEAKIPLFEERCEQFIKEELEALLYKSSRELGADVAGFGYLAAKNFPSQSSFSSYRWKERYPLSKFKVSVNIDIVSPGLIICPDEAEEGGE